MECKCNNCQRLNYEEQLFCEYCKAPLYNLTDILDRLTKKQTEIETRHQKEIQKINEEIHFLHLAIKDNASEHDVKSEIKQPIVDSAPTISVVDETASHKPEPAHIHAAVENINKEPSEILVKLRSLLEPLHLGFSFVNEVYSKYKVEGKLPIFFMTLAGIAAILFGFGYLMQYSMQYLGIYGGMVKIGLGFVSAVSFGVFGIRLYGKSNTFHEFGSALISLGIALNYTMIYFLSGLGDFPLFSSSLFGFALIILNTGAAIYLSLKFETKIVAVLFLIGGAFAPFYLNSTSDGSLYYLYLWFLIAGTNFVAYKIKWSVLHYFSFAVGFILLEVAVFSYYPNSLLYTIYYHLYAYTFFYFILFNKIALKDKLDKTDIFLLSANLTFLLFNLFSTNQNLVLLGFIYLGNSLVFGMILLKWWKPITKIVRLTLFIISGSFIGFAIPVLFDQSLMGLFWSIEAILLVILGFLYGMPIVRKEGYIVLLIAVVKLLLSSSALIEKWDNTIWHEGLSNYIVLGGVTTALWFIGQKFSSKFSDFEISLFKWSKELVPLWLSSIFIIVAYDLLGAWGLNLVFIPLFGLIYWSKYFQTKYTAFFGLGYMFFFLLSWYISFLDTHSLRLHEQLLYAKLSIAELVICLWFVKKYYGLLNLKESTTYKYAHILRVTFFVIIPLFLCQWTFRHASDFFVSTIWIGVIITFYLHKRLKYSALLIELFLFFFAGIYMTIIEFDIWAMITGIGVLLTINIAEKAYALSNYSNSKYVNFYQLSPHVTSLLISLALYTFFGDLALSITLFAFLQFLLSYYKDSIAAIHKTYAWVINLAAGVNLLSLFTIPFNESPVALGFAFINLILFGVILYNRGNWYNTLGSKWKGAILFHQIQSVLLYSVVLLLMDIKLEGALYTVLIVIHAILLLFISLKNNIKIINKISAILFGLALLKVVFNDIRDFDTAQKVVVLIILGVLLLGASFAYVRLKNHFEKSNIEQRIATKISVEQQEKTM